MTAEQAPSIGSKAMSFDPSGQRVRQIIETPIANPAELADILDQADAFAEQTDATRTVVRVLAPTDEMDPPNGFATEARIRLSGNFGGLYFSYLGSNRPDRTSAVVAQEMGLLAGVLERPVKTPAEILKDAETRGFQLERLHGAVSPEDHSRLIAMYRSSFSSYPFSIEDKIAEMVSHPGTQVYAARSIEDGRLYSVAATEQVVLDTPKGPLTMREMGDSAKMPGDRGKGLNAALKVMLISEAAQDGVDMLFCESRAALGAVNAVNHSIGMQWSGFLPKHTVISGPADVNEVASDGPINGQYGNMNVWACNSGQIHEIGEQVQAYHAAR